MNQQRLWITEPFVMDGPVPEQSTVQDCARILSGQCLIILQSRLNSKQTFRGTLKNGKIET